MHKCQNTFSQLESGEAEIQSEELNGGAVNITVRIVRNCCDCGTEVKEATFEFDEDHSEELDAHTATHNAEVTYDLDVTAEITERTQDTDRRGKKIKNSRYMKQMFGAEVCYTVTCSVCGDAVVENSLLDEVQASGMDELE